MRCARPPESKSESTVIGFFFLPFFFSLACDMERIFFLSLPTPISHHAWIQSFPSSIPSESNSHRLFDYFFLSLFFFHTQPPSPKRLQDHDHTHTHVLHMYTFHPNPKPINTPAVDISIPSDYSLSLSRITFILTLMLTGRKKKDGVIYFGIE